MMTGWELLMSAAVKPEDIETLCVRLGGGFGQVPVKEAQLWLSQMNFYASYDDDGWDGTPTFPKGAQWAFQVWTPQRIYRTEVFDRLIFLQSVPRTPEHWMRVMTIKQELRDLSTGRMWRRGEPV